MCDLRKYIIRKATVSVCNALVGICLDYCNALFRCQSKSIAQKLQCTQMDKLES